MSKLLLVDCDGTIREAASGKTFIEDPHDQKIIEGADTALSYYQEKGWVIMGITNQGGVAAGKKTLGACIEEQRETLELLPQINSILFCPDFNGNECYWICPSKPSYPIHENLNWEHLKGRFRKPNQGMIDLAVAMNGRVEQSDCWYVGDRPEDSQAAAAAGVNFCSAEVWRDRFKPGMHKIEGASAKLIEFLEEIKINHQNN